MDSDMRAKYESLPVGVLKSLAGSRGIRGISRLKKAEVVEAMLKKDAEEGKEPEKVLPAAAPLEKQQAAEQTEDKPKRRRGRPPKKRPAEEAAQESPKAEDKASARTGQNRESAAQAEEKADSAGTEEKKASARAEENRETASEQTRENGKASRAKRGRPRLNRRTEHAPETIEQEKAKEQTPRAHAAGGMQRPEAGKSEAEKPDIRKPETGKPEAAGNLHGTEQRKAEAPVSSAKEPAGKEPAAETKAQESAPAIRQDVLKYHDLREASGILEVLSEGYGFIRSANYMPGDNDLYVSPSQIRRFSLRTGDILTGKTRKNNPTDKYGALLYIDRVNGGMPERAAHRVRFEKMTPVFPNERIVLEYPGCSAAMRIVDLFSPLGKGQRGMIVSQPKAGKTTLLKEIAKSVKSSHPDMHIIVLLIDERPEEVTDMKESIEGDNVEVIYSTFDEEPEHHKRVSEMTIERAKRLVEYGQDVMILLDSITRLSRAYNLTVPPSGRTLSGGLDPTALYRPKKFFGAARNMREGGSLTILATALVNTGSKMDDVVYEEFKGTGNMELVLDRKLSEKRVFPAFDLAASGTRRDDLLLTADEQEAMEIIRRGLNGMRKDDATESVLNMITHTRTNADFVRLLLRRRIL